jgi:hypothetical protein
MVQLMTSMDTQQVQQPVIAPIPTIIQVTTSLSTYVPRGYTTNHWMEDNLETHLEEVHMEEIRLENHLLIHLLDLMDG